jgi:hypothetical protein
MKRYSLRFAPNQFVQVWRRTDNGPAVYVGTYTTMGEALLASKRLSPMERIRVMAKRLTPAQRARLLLQALRNRQRQKETA